MILFRIVAVVFALVGLLGLTFFSYQMLLTLAYGAWAALAMSFLGVCVTGVMTCSAPWLWRQGGL